LFFFAFAYQDGFRGTYDEVAAHEEALASGTLTSTQVGAEELVHLYEAPDGFRGTYDEVAAHEETLGAKYCEATGAVLPHEPAGPLEPLAGAAGAKVQDLLAELGMGHFALAFHNAGVDYRDELNGGPRGGWGLVACCFL
jgi:hypothetical protein